MKQIEGVIEIIKENKYLTLSTVSKDLIPWCTPLFYTYDKEINFYWFSAKDSKHSHNINQNKNTSLVIFDSIAEIGDGDAVFFEGETIELNIIEEVKIAINFLNKRFDNNIFKFKSVSQLTNKSINRAYKFIPRKCYSLTDLEIDGEFVTRRVEFNITDLRKFIK